MNRDTAEEVQGVLGFGPSVVDGPINTCSLHRVAEDNNVSKRVNKATANWKLELTGHAGVEQLSVSPNWIALVAPLGIEANTTEIGPLTVRTRT